MKQNEIENLDFLAHHKYVCEFCDERFKSRTTVWRHKKKCVLNPKNQEEIFDSLQKNLENLENEKIENEKIDNKNIEILLSKLEKKDKQNEELWKAFHEQQNYLNKLLNKIVILFPE